MEIDKNCACHKTYKCLYCEDKENGVIKIDGEKVKRSFRKRNKNPKPRVIAQCGTRSGYGKHLRSKEKPCTLCKKAQSEYVKEFTRNKQLKRAIFQRGLN